MSYRTFGSSRRPCIVIAVYPGSPPMMGMNPLRYEQVKRILQEVGKRKESRVGKGVQELIISLRENRNIMSFTPEGCTWKVDESLGDFEVTDPPPPEPAAICKVHHCSLEPKDRAIVKRSHVDEKRAVEIEIFEYMGGGNTGDAAVTMLPPRAEELVESIVAASHGDECAEKVRRIMEAYRRATPQEGVLDSEGRVDGVFVLTTSITHAHIDGAWRELTWDYAMQGFRLVESKPIFMKRHGVRRDQLIGLKVRWIDRPMRKPHNCGRCGVLVASTLEATCVKEGEALNG